MPKPLTGWITVKMREILKEMGISDYLTCLLRNLYAGQEATVRPGHGTTVQFSSVAQSCPTLCDPMNHSTPGLPVHHQLPEFTQTRVHRVSDAIQPSHPLLSTFPPAPNPSQHQSLFQWVNSLHEVAKVLCTAHHVKCWAGWSTSWNEDSCEKYQ